MLKRRTSATAAEDRSEDAADDLPRADRASDRTDRALGHGGQQTLGLSADPSGRGLRRPIRSRR